MQAIEQIVTVTENGELTIDAPELRAGERVKVTVEPKPADFIETLLNTTIDDLPPHDKI
jgi:hypothetical protein